MTDGSSTADKVLITAGALLSGFALPDDGRFVFAMGEEVAIDAVFRDIDLTADEPFGEGCLPIEHLLPLRLPSEFAGFARPELIGSLDAFCI